MQVYSLAQIAFSSLLVHLAGVEGGPLPRERRYVSPSTLGVRLLEQPCPASQVVTVRSDNLPYVPILTTSRLHALKNRVKTVKSTFSSRLGSPYVLTLLETYPRTDLEVITRTLGAEDRNRARDSNKRAAVLSEIKYWLLVYAVYSEYIQTDEQGLIDRLHLSENEALVDQTEQVLQQMANIVCEVHLTIPANGFQEDTAMYEPVRSIEYIDNLTSVNMFGRNYVIAYDFIKFIDYAILFFEDWAKEVQE